MPGFTKKNLRDDVDDQAAKHGFGPAFESRFPREGLGAEQTGLSFQRLAPGSRTPFAHRHEQAEEIYVVVGGGGRVLLGDEVVELRRLDAVRVEPATVRAFEAGDEGLEILVFGPHVAGDAAVQPAAWPGD
jgi:uncharacterized cupin superfamily protein